MIVTVANSPWRTVSRTLARISLLVFVASMLEPAFAQREAYSEHEVKAAFLYHFGTYIEWPEELAPAQGVSIAVLGDEEVYEQLDLFLPGRRILDLPVSTRHVESMAELGAEEILFIGRTANNRLERLLAEAASPGRLIVTDSPRGLQDGAAVNFLTIDNRIRFVISMATARDAQLMLSSRLLSAAYSVEP